MLVICTYLFASAFCIWSGWMVIFSCEFLVEKIVSTRKPHKRPTIRQHVPVQAHTTAMCTHAHAQAVTRMQSHLRGLFAKNKAQKVRYKETRRTVQNYKHICLNAHVSCVGLSVYIRTSACTCFRLSGVLLGQRGAESGPIRRANSVAEWARASHVHTYISVPLNSHFLVGYN